MLKTLATLALLSAIPATAATIVTVGGSNQQPTLDFSSKTPAGYTVKGNIYNQNITNVALKPNTNSGKYLAAQADATASITSKNPFSAISFDWGSIDTYNTLNLLNKNGSVAYSFTGSQLANYLPVNYGSSTARVNFNSTDKFYGAEFKTTQPAFEVDNVTFGNAVPEPTTWMLFMVGFGMIGYGIRKKTNRVVYA